MLMVVFGAGASYDSAQAFRPPRPQGGGHQNFGQPPPILLDNEQWRPPLADNLFSDPHSAFGTFVTKYPKIRAVLPLLRERSNKSVEEILESLQNEAGEYVERHRQLAAVRFYLRDLLAACTSYWIERTGGVTNYESLIDQIWRWHRTGEEICLVTFNYDLLLDHALYTFGFRPKEPRHFLASHPIFKVFKLHGSVDWARSVDFPTQKQGANALIEQAEEINLMNEWLTVNPNENERGDLPLFPCIAIPVQTKTKNTFECPPQHLAHLQNFLKQVNKILIVGWQAREAHFLELLRSNLSNLSHLMVVCGNSEAGKKVIDYFIQQVGPNAATAKGYISTGGFTDFVVNRQGDEFFKA